jgi:hypothetical protein
MDVDSRGLGRLQRVADPRQVWAMEAGDFTPWLAENLDVLADELGLVLTAVATEVPVGAFFLDIRAETEDGRAAIVENQKPWVSWWLASQRRRDRANAYERAP